MRNLFFGLISLPLMFMGADVFAVTKDQIIVLSGPEKNEYGQQGIGWYECISTTGETGDGDQVIYVLAISREHAKEVAASCLN